MNIQTKSVIPDIGKNSFHIKKNNLLLIALYYLYIPLALFLCAWVNICISIPLALLLGISPLLLCKQSMDNGGSSVTFTRRQIFITMIVLSAWVVLSGIGGYAWQNRWDHSFRNAVFNDLVNRPWPVADGENILTYYIGFWLPPAAIAKLTGPIWIGRFCQLLYGFAGIMIAFLLTVEKVGNFRLRYLIPFILFSGLDIVGILFSGESIRQNFHLELWSPLAFWESNTTMLFWVYNQAIPSWVATMILLNSGFHKGIPALTLCFLTISAPFSVVGLFPLALYYIIRRSFLAGNWRNGLKLLFSPANIISLLGALPVMFYFMFNNQTETYISFIPLTSWSGIKDFFLILILEIGVFAIFLYQQLKKNIEFHILLLTAVACLFIHMGSSIDFNSRVELPLNFFLTTQIIIYITHLKKKKLSTRLLYFTISFLAVITPFLEISRTLYQSIRVPRSQYISMEKESIFEFEVLRNNFVTDSIGNRREPPLGFRLFNYHKPSGNK